MRSGKLNVVLTKTNNLSRHCVL